MHVDRVVFQGFEGVNLVADVRGDEDAWPVLLLHGGGQTRHAWDKAADYIASQGWLTVSIDLRGHGESQWSEKGDYSFTAFSADCLCVVDQFANPPVLVGASLGGISALLAEGTSDRVVSSGLVLVDIAPKASPEGVRKIRDFMRSGLNGFDSLEDVATAIAAYTPQRVRPVNLDGLKKVVRMRKGRWYWHWDPLILSQERTEVVAQRFADLIDIALRNITVPTMLVRGLLSDVVTQEGVDHLVARIPDIKVVEVEGAAHMIAGDKNDAFSDAVSTFLRDRVAPHLSQ